MEEEKKVGEKRERSKITEPCKFSLPEVKGDSLEVVEREGSFGASGQVVPATASLWEPQV